MIQLTFSQIIVSFLGLGVLLGLIQWLLAKWIKYREDAPKYLDGAGLINLYEELNQMSLEISLWIKDEKLLTEIMHRLQNKPDAKDIRTLSGKIRNLILGTNDNFNPQEIVLWPVTEIGRSLFPSSFKKDVVE